MNRAVEELCRWHAVAEVWLGHVTIPALQLHVIQVEWGADQAASSYAETTPICKQFGGHDEKKEGR